MLFDIGRMQGTAPDGVDAAGPGHCHALAVSASWDVVRTPSSSRRHWNRCASTTRRRRGRGAGHARHRPAAGDLLPAVRLRGAEAGAAHPLDGLFLAGEWTDTELPSTIEARPESAVRAVDEVTRYLTATAAPC
ncbi:hypothetical protein [Nocardia jiangsuensis]|uniref:Flavin-dependent amine oxidoreductase n=1 Tax=Nocardia jiangsuensis TaxID=1691563 RepID=A0ABV8E4T5_9NOCA